MRTHKSQLVKLSKVLTILFFFTIIFSFKSKAQVFDSLLKEYSVDSLVSIVNSAYSKINFPSQEVSINSFERFAFLELYIGPTFAFKDMALSVLPLLVKEAKKDLAFAKLNNCPTSPRKMRLVADLVRGKKVEEALAILKFNTKEASNRVEKLLVSAIANWQAKNETASIEEADLFVKEIRVDGGAMLKRLRPAPQGRAHRIRKRSNHVTLVLGDYNNIQSE